MQASINNPGRIGHLSRSRRVCVAVPAILAPCAQAHDLPRMPPESVGMSSDRLARIRVAMQRYVDRGEVPGVVTLVARRGQIVHFNAVGYSDVDAKTPMSTGTIFRIASMTKPITSVALLMLYE